MPALQIRDLPTDLHRILKARAAQRGQSLSEYATEVLRRAAQTPTFEELAERLRARGAAGDVTVESITQRIRSEREAR